MRNRIVYVLMFVAFATFIQLSAQQTQKPYVIVVSLDGFRWDYLDRGLTPHLNQMAAEGVRALSMQPIFPTKTFPNHYTIATGLFAPNHGLISNRFTNPYSGQSYRLGDTVSVRDARWYRGETIWVTARREGIKTASFFWPGSETRPDYTHPTYFRHYDGSIPHDERIEGVMEWLQLPEAKRPQLIFLYFSDTDTEGHRFGPESPEVNTAIELLDKKVGLLNERLEAIGMKEHTNVLVVSDHGMAEVADERAVVLSNLIDTEDIRIADGGPFMQLFLQAGASAEHVYRQLNKHARHFKVYQRENIPDYYHYRNHPFIGDLLLVADVGWSLLPDREAFERMQANDTRGNHGYDNHHIDMHGIFIADGPAFKSGYRCGTVHNIDMYPLITEILGMRHNNMIDGEPERIRFLLRETE